MQDWSSAPEPVPRRALPCGAGTWSPSRAACGPSSAGWTWMGMGCWMRARCTTRQRVRRAARGGGPRPPRKALPSLPSAPLLTPPWGPSGSCGRRSKVRVWCASRGVQCSCAGLPGGRHDGAAAPLLSSGPEPNSGRAAGRLVPPPARPRPTAGPSSSQETPPPARRLLQRWACPWRRGTRSTWWRCWTATATAG